MRVRLLFIYFPLWTSAASSFIVCAEVIKMAVVQDEILDAFITELRERALSEFRHGEKENQDRYERVRELSIKLRNILSHFSEENRQTIESYMEEKDSLTSDEFDYVYLQGIIDCCKMLKMLKII